MPSHELTGLPEDPATIAALDARHVFHSWSAQALVDPLPIASAQGSYFTDYQGNRYLDFASQLVNVNIGHQHPKLVAAIQEQAARLCTIAPSFANDARSEAARMIAELRAGRPRTRCSSPTAAPRQSRTRCGMARLHTGRHKVLAAYRSYHGATAGAISLTGDPRRWASEPGLPGIVRYWGPYLYRSAFHASTPDGGVRAGARAPARRDHGRGAANDCGGRSSRRWSGTNGILVPPPGYLAGVRAICDEFGIVMIADEVMAGFGRCGEWFAVDHWGVTPDLITFAKGVNSGYVPLGGVVISDPIAATFARAGLPRRPDLLRPSARLRQRGRVHHGSSPRKASSSTPAARRRRDRARAGQDGRPAPVGRRGARAGRLLGARAGPRPGDPRAAGAVQRRRSGRRSR